MTINKPLVYTMGDIILVVIGILITIQINNLTNLKNEAINLKESIELELKNINLKND